MARSTCFAALFCLAAQVALARFRSFDLTITWENGAPDGFTRPVFKVNGQFPGPTLELDQGDDVVVNVRNKSPVNTTIHFHGIEQQGTPWSDGTPGLSQFQIQPGCKFVYQWKATQHGSYYYHAHSRAQSMDGLMGAITIHPSGWTPAPYGLISNDPRSIMAMKRAERSRIPLLLNDWTHYTADEAWDNSQKTNGQNTCQDSMLINGRGAVTCLTPEQQGQLITPEIGFLLSMVPGSQLTDKSCLPPAVIAWAAAPGTPPPDDSEIPKNFFYGCAPSDGGSWTWPVTQQSPNDETWVMFDLVGAYGETLAFASFDELPMHVVAVDGNWIEPQTVEYLQVANGERYTVMVNPKTPKKYTFRLAAAAPIQIMWALATLDFKVRGKPQSTAASVPYINEAASNTSADLTTFNVDSAPPYPANHPPQKADATYTLTMEDFGIYAALNQSPLLLPSFEDSTPLLLKPQPTARGNTTLTIPSSAKVVDYIILSAEGGPTHPIHLHGRHFYVLGRGSGNFTWATVDEAMAAMPNAFNLNNPPIRDTMPTSQDANNWMVLRRTTDNPGAWLMHCHITNHFQGGQGIIIQEGPEHYPRVPSQYQHAQC